MIQCRPHGITNRHRRLGPDDEAGLRSGSGRAGTTRWIALDGLHVQRAAAADHLLDLVGPDPCRVDDHAGAGSRARVRPRGRRRGRRPARSALAQESRRPAPGSRAGRRARQAVRATVTRAGRRRPGSRSSGSRPRSLGAKSGRSARPACGQVPVPGHAHSYCPTIAIASYSAARRRRRAAPSRVGERVEERHRPDQVRRQPGEQQPALLERLADQPEVEHLEVAQPPWISLLLRLLVPLARSRCSSRPVFRPRVTASSAVPVPTIPPRPPARQARRRLRFPPSPRARARGTGG
jgi:hypothetical protein